MYLYMSIYLNKDFSSSRQPAGGGPLFYKLHRVGRRARLRSQRSPGTSRPDRRLAAWVRSLGISDPTLQPNHAWRHTFKQIADRAGISERTSDVITGHAPKSVGSGYGTAMLGDTAEAMKRFPRYELGERLALRDSDRFYSFRVDSNKPTVRGKVRDMQEFAGTTPAGGRAPEGPDASDTVIYRHFTSLDAPAPNEENLLKAPTLQQLLEATFSDRQHLLFPWLREQESCMVYADTGVGKSLFALSAALAVAGGASFSDGNRMNARVGAVARAVHRRRNARGGHSRTRTYAYARGTLRLTQGRPGPNLRFLARQHQEPDAAFPLITEACRNEVRARVCAAKCNRPGDPRQLLDTRGGGRRERCVKLQCHPAVSFAAKGAGRCHDARPSRRQKRRLQRLKQTRGDIRDNHKT